ncbi:DUF3386 family protein [Trichocoleus sp. FACHB-591]|uniref:DUF3386 family protein n=1 Tax=Trichocoleus sp. FACHB-591 TaxID=2692872 RepID=UPI0018EFEC7D|nr:DUF3386 family protein [Trichocoleus sp. FACHB-591]
MMLRKLKRFFLAWSVSLLLAIASFSWVAPVQAGPMPIDDQGQPKTQLSARDIFRDAYEQRYTWNEKFPGYQAEVSLKYDGQLYHGLAQVSPDFQVTVKNMDDPDVSQLVKNQLQMEIIHRRQIAFGDRHDQDTYALDGTDKDGAFEIQETGDNGESRYKVRDKKIVQVNRTLGSMAVTVDSLEFITPAGGYLTEHFQTTFRDPKGKEVLLTQDVTDSHEKIGNYYLLTNRTIRSSDPKQPKQLNEADTLIRFNNIQPLRRA